MKSICSKCYISRNNDQLMGNGMIPTDFRYPKPDVFRLHHKQKAASLCRDGSLLRGRQCSSATKSAQNSVWIKQNSKDLKDQTTNRHKENYDIIKESIPVHQKHPLNYGYGSMTTFEKKQGLTNKDNVNSINNSQIQNSGYSNQENSINFGSFISPNTSCSSLPLKKRRIMSDFTTKSKLNCDKSPLIEESHQEFLQDDVFSESKNFQEDFNCPYYYMETLLNGHYEQSDIPNYAVVQKHTNSEAKENAEITSTNETKDQQNISVNSIAQKVPKTLNLTNNNQRKIVPHQSTQETITPIIEKVFSPISLPRYNKVNGIDDMHDVQDKFLSPNSTSMFNVNKANGSKEPSPQNSDSSIFKMHVHNDVPSRNILQFSNSKSCLKYKKAIAISGLAFGTIMIMTFSVLYWNYVEAVHRRMAKTKDGPILDHWGKVSEFLFISESP